MYSEVKHAQEDKRAFTYLVGIGVSHSIAPLMHNYIARSLGYNWKFLAKECPTVEDAIKLFREPTFAGGVVTMPYKSSIMQYLDGLDEYATKLGACNNVYLAKDGTLQGTNTDWRGVKGCLLETSLEGQGKPGLIIGAGGASRAAVYTLFEQLQCNPIYIVNRDIDEVKTLLRDCKAYGSRLNLIHIRSVDQAKSLQSPYYIVGTVPDFEPQSKTEIECRDILESFLESAQDKGVLLDMCFKPRQTRNLKLGERYGWRVVQGIGVIGHQVEEQYRLWCGDEDSRRICKEDVWKVLLEAADASKAINF